MGVHGLWELLAPVGRRVSVETLAGKKLAIDASIWMVQFMKAMRDEKGEMVRNAHILGFFRRICKLLFLRTKPVFVFDGGTPALKRRTVIARRRRRENAQAKIRKTAEKLLLNHLKATKLKELAADLQRQRQEDDIKGKRPILQEPDNEPEAYKGNDGLRSNFDQEKNDELLAASLAAEENEDIEVDDGYEEMMMIPEMHGKVDPAVLALLPPSMQLDLLVQMRERLMAENRQRYQKVKKAPEKFSEIQIEAYLKKVAFRRELEVVQKSTAGQGVGGVQTSRIASEANREFIFSSSFTGDKQSFTSGEESMLLSDQMQPHPVVCSSVATGEALPTNGTGGIAAPPAPDTGGLLDGIETYLDEKGRLRVSRVRALGIRMTRDLQRNLDLMKEINNETEGILSGLTLNQDAAEGSDTRMGDELKKNNGTDVFYSIPIEISFEHATALENISDDGDLFDRLVAGQPVLDFTVDAPASLKDRSVSSSECEWEEGVVGDTALGSEAEIRSEGVVSDEGEVEWEEGLSDTQFTSTHREGSLKNVSKGVQEEEDDLQEAIRRSLEDASCRSFQEINDHVSAWGGGMAREAAMSSGKKGPEDAMPCVSKGFGGSTDSAIGLSSSFMESTPQPNLEYRNKDPDGNWNLSGDQYRTTDTPSEEEVIAQGKKSDEILDGAGERDSENEGVEPHHVSVKGDAGFDSFISSVADLPHAKLLDSSTADTQYDVSQTASDEKYRSSIQFENATHYGSTSYLHGEKQVAEDKLESTVSIEMETSMGNSFLDVNNEQEMLTEYIEDQLSSLSKESEQLQNKQQNLEKITESVSSEMFAECQELLQMFGLPYIVAPLEAEAQCAYMELSNLVDGVVTDDSDALLFGARSIYKNIFDDRKYVETYFMKDIETELGLDREKLINMALLLGSDYTEGISGIGIVNAVEVVNAFPDIDGLREFREWIESPDPSILGTVDTKAVGHSRKKASQADENIQRHSDDQTDSKKRIFMGNHRNVSKNWHIPSSFPSEAVISAYVSPHVDKSTEPFSWGKPDHSALRKLCMEKFGWGTTKADELLLPVLKEYGKHETQLRLEAFYTFNERFAKIRSKRIMKAVKGITGKMSSEFMDVTAVPLQTGRGNKRKVSAGEDEDGSGGTSEEKHLEESLASESSARRKATRGRGRGGRSKRQPSEARARKRNPCGDAKADDGGGEEKLEGSLELRRSARPRKAVSYRFSELDKDDEESLDKGSSVHSSGGQASKNEDNQSDDHHSEDRIASYEEPERAYAADNATTCHDDQNALLLPASSSDDYLRFGGGFCSVDNEEAEGVDGRTPVTDSGELDAPDSSEPLVEAGHEVQSDQHAELGNPSSSNPFRPMPGLRRKKKTT